MTTTDTFTEASAYDYGYTMGRRPVVMGEVNAEPEPEQVCDVWVRADGQAGTGDRDDPIFTAVRYRPVIMCDSGYSQRTAWAAPDVHSRGPLVVRQYAGVGKPDALVSLVMPVAARGGGAEPLIRWA